MIFDRLYLFQDLHLLQLEIGSPLQDTRRIRLLHRRHSIQVFMLYFFFIIDALWNVLVYIYSRGKYLRVSAYEQKPTRWVSRNMARFF